MKYSTFEDLPVWNKAIAFALAVFKFTANADLRGFGDKQYQLERSALSVSNNIAEGFERGSTADLRSENTKFKIASETRECGCSPGRC